MKTQIDRLIHEMRGALQNPDLTPSEKRNIARWLNMAISGRYEYEELVDEAKNIGARNPSFDGDMVGWTTTSPTEPRTAVEHDGNVMRLVWPGHP